MVRMFLLSVGFVTVIFSPACCASPFPDRNARPIADEVETAKYAGRWYPVSMQILFHTNEFFFAKQILFLNWP